MPDPYNIKHHPRSLNALQGWFFYHTNDFTKLNGRSLWNAGQREGALGV